jgi:hypothetical protein
MAAGNTLDFQPAARLEFLAGIELVDVTDSPDGFAAIGTLAGEPTQGIANRVVILTSKDGQSWRRVPDDPQFRGAFAVSIAHGPGGLFAIGAGESGHDWPAWRSPDGVTWSAVAPDQLGLPNGLASLDGSPERWLGIGSPLGSVVTDSADGVTWHATVVPASGRGGKAPIVERVVAGRWGWLATGSEPVDCGFLIWEGDCAAYRAAWWSDGLGDWSAIPDVPAIRSDARIVAAGDHGLLAIAGADAWSSVDGLAWLAMRSPDESRVVVADVVVIGDRIVAVGEVLGVDGVSSDGWIGVGSACCN